MWANMELAYERLPDHLKRCHRRFAPASMEAWCSWRLADTERPDEGALTRP